MNFIIGIIVIIVVIGIIGSILSFMWEHKLLSIAIILGIAVIFDAMQGFEVTMKVLSAISSFFYNITYEQTIFDTIWIYAGEVVFSFALAVGFSSVIEEKYHNIVTAILLVLSLALVFFVNDVTCVKLFLTEILVSIGVLGGLILNASMKIGICVDSQLAQENAETLNWQILILGILSESGIIINLANSKFHTTIPLYLPTIVICLLLLLLEIKCYTSLFKGYRFINKFIKTNAFFVYSDFAKRTELDYLKKSKEYSSSVLAIMERKQKVYLISGTKGVYCNKYTYKLFEKGINENLSSEVLRERLALDFQKVAFDTVYKHIFAKVKKYCLEFEASTEEKTKRQIVGGLASTEFILMRYPIEKHPILQENHEIRMHYLTALDSIVTNLMRSNAKWNSKKEEYMMVFGVESFCENPEYAISRFSSVVVRKAGFFRRIKTNYSYLLLLEAIYFSNLLMEQAISFKEIEAIFEKLKIRRKDRDFIYQYIKSMFIEREVDEAQLILNSKVDKNVKRSLEYIHRNLMWNERYITVPQYNVAVCATMSAGKSTFINAILGVDYIPSKNQACTAKITTIRDNDNLLKMIGCYAKNNGEKGYSSIIDNDVLREWNDDDDIMEVILEGDIEDISCHNDVLVIYDTPGTNNSEDMLHHDRTIDFVKNTQLDVVIYLINAEYVSTNDTAILFKEINEIIKERKTKVIFGLNKIDSIDEEGDESVKQVIQGLEEQLKGYGVENPIIFPFSANAARLFKMVLKGKELTKREKRSFYSVYEFFSRFNASDYVVNASSLNSSEYYPKLKVDKTIVIEDEEYKYNKIVELLGNTGILCIEKWISEKGGTQ